MKTIIVLFSILVFSSCGRQDSNECRSREHMRLECRAVNQQSYGPYAQDMCNRSYEADRCY